MEKAGISYEPLIVILDYINDHIQILTLISNTLKYYLPFIIGCLNKAYGEDNSVKELLDYLAGWETAE